jgi:hypothetical protein
MYAAVTVRRFKSVARIKLVKNGKPYRALVICKVGRLAIAL